MRVIGKLVRWPLRLVRPTATMRILRGPLRGTRWVAGSSTHGCWLGTYERKKQKSIRQVVTAGTVAYDIGANVGFYTLLFSRLVGPRGAVIAFEPLPRNAEYLRGHVSANDLHNVRLIEAAVAGADGVLPFADGDNPLMGRLANDGGRTVRAVTLNALVANGTLPPPSYMKIDVEGAEADVLRGATDVLSTARPTIWLATHGWQAYSDCLDILTRHRYHVESLSGMHDEWLATPL